jgi:hypothetical protein
MTLPWPRNGRCYWVLAEKSMMRVGGGLDAGRPATKVMQYDGLSQRTAVIPAKAGTQ